MAKKIKDEVLYQLTGFVMARGVMTIIFGVIALVWPGITLVSLAVLTAIWLFLSGIIGALSSIFMRENYDHWFLKLALSLLQFGVGAYLVQRPEISIATFIVAIAIVFIVEGIIETVISLTDDSEKDGSRRMLGVVGGILTVIAGIIIWRYPDVGTLAFVWVLGLTALVVGTLNLWSAIDTRRNLS